MIIKRYHILSLLLLLFLIACGNKKKATLTADQLTEADDFVSFYPTASLPYTVETGKLFSQPKDLQKQIDSLLVPEQTFQQFVPDSIVQKDFPKQTGLKIYALSKAQTPGGNWFLFTGIHAKSLASVILLVFDKKNKYVTSMTVWRNDHDLGKNFETIVNIDKRATITRTKSRRNTDGSTSEGKEIYSYSNDEKIFQLEMVEALDDKLTELINPIDTLPRKHKLSGDYTNGKLNLVSIRDGRRSDRLSFFIHFEKNNGECTGELKAEAIIRSPTLAEYRISGDPCILQFRFTNNMVILKEVEGCGSRRGLRCSYDGSYPKKKEPVKPKK